MLSLLNHYQMLTDEFILFYTKGILTGDELNKLFSLESVFAQKWSLAIELTTEKYISQKKDLTQIIVSNGVNHPSETKKSDLEDLISNILELIKPFRSH